MKNHRLKLLLELYITFFKLGCVSFGGGYSTIPLMEREVVKEKEWIDKEKIVDIFAVAGTLPGAISLNASAFAGYSVAKIPGAVSALLGNMTPSVIIVLVLTGLFSKYGEYPAVKAAFRGVYPVVVGLILYAAYKIAKTSICDIVGIVIAALAFIGALFFDIEPIPIIIAGAVAGLLIDFLKTFHIMHKHTETIGKETNCDDSI